MPRKKKKDRLLDEGYGWREIRAGVDAKGHFIEIRIYTDPTDAAMQGASERLNKEFDK